MQIVVFLLIIMAYVATMFSGGDGNWRRQQVASRAEAMASRMQWHHTEAMRRCSVPGTCLPGEVVIQFPPQFSAAAAFGVVTVTDGEQLVTVAAGDFRTDEVAPIGWTGWRRR